MIELGLRSLLLSHAPLTTLIPPQTVNGIRFQSVFNEHPAQGVNPPFVLISLIDEDPKKVMEGTPGFTITEFDIDCYGRTYPESAAIAGQVASLLKDYRGNAGTHDRIEAVLWNDRRYDQIFDADGRDVRQHILSINLSIQHQPRVT